MSFMRNKTLGAIGTTLGVVIVAALAVVVLGAQQGPPPGRGPGGRGMGMGMGQGMGMFGPGQRGPAAIMMMRGLRQLNLTDAQKQQIKGVMQSHKDEFKAIADRMIAARTALNDAVTADKPDQNDITAKAAAVAAVELDAALLRSKVHGEVFALLTPEQQAKAKQLRADAKNRIGKRMGRMGRGMGGRGRGMGGPGAGGPGRGFGGWI